MKNPCHPGEILKDVIVNGLGLTIKAAANSLGVSRKQLSQILNEKAGISTEMALRLERRVGSTAEHWLRLQMALYRQRANGDARRP